MAEFAKIKDILDDLRNHFFDRLKKKTGWGKEEVKIEFERAISDTMIAAWDKKDSTP